MSNWRTGLFESDLIHSWGRIDVNAQEVKINEWDKIMVDELVMNAKILVGLDKERVFLSDFSKAEL